MPSNSLLSRLFSRREDPREALRPLWHDVEAVSREPVWYADCGVADTVPGRFDAITLVLSLVLLRMEGEDALIEPSVRLTEIFVEDMDGQLRESGVGDVVVGKHIGKLMSVLGGRLGAYREALGQDEAAMVEAVTRNVSLAESGDPARVARQAMVLSGQLAALSAEDVLAARIAR